MGNFKKWVKLREAGGEPTASSQPEDKATGAYGALVNANAFKTATGRDMKWSSSWINRKKVIKPVFDQLEYFTSKAHMGVLLRDVKRLIHEMGAMPEEVETEPTPDGMTEDEQSENQTQPTVRPNNQFRAR